jgi:copper(I)-binding protein
MKRLRLAIIVAAVLDVKGVYAQEAKVDNIKIEGAYTPSTVSGQKAAAGFMKIIGQGAAD